MAMGPFEAVWALAFLSDEAAVKFTLSIGFGNGATATLKATETDAKSPADSEVPEIHHQLVGHKIESLSTIRTGHHTRL
jgi:hypothetical protein